MGVINCSYESFYNDSYIPNEKIHETAIAMVEQGADIIDIGARSTAPNAQAISGTEESSRIDKALKELDGTGITISVDTMNPWVLDVCLKHEIHAVNDISGLASPAFSKRIAESGLPAFLMATIDQPGDPVGIDATIAALTQSRSGANPPGLIITSSTRRLASGHRNGPLTITGNSAGTLRGSASSTAPSSPRSPGRASSATCWTRNRQDRLAGSLAVTAMLLEKGPRSSGPTMSARPVT